MSAPRREFVLSPDARIDFTDILLYTLRRWGEEQLGRHQAILERAIAELGDYPEAGVRRDRLFLGCRIRRVERHVLYYLIENDTITVVRILHERTDPTRHLQS